MGVLYDRIRNRCPTDGCQIPIEAFNMAMIGWIDGVWTQQEIIDAFSLTAEEVGPGDGTYLTLEDLKTWYLASTEKLKFVFIVGQIFRHLECVNTLELTQLDATDLQVCNYIKTL